MEAPWEVMARAPSTQPKQWKRGTGRHTCSRSTKGLSRSKHTHVEPAPSRSTEDYQRSAQQASGSNQRKRGEWDVLHAMVVQVVNGLAGWGGGWGA